MVEWFRVDLSIRTNEKFRVVGMSLGCSRDVARHFALGAVMFVLANVAEHRPDGVLAGIDDDVLEDWAHWRGEAGVFARVFREHFITDGHLSGWADRQVGLIAMQEEKSRKRVAKNTRDRERLAALRSGDKPATPALRSGDDPAYTNTNSSTSPPPPPAPPTLVLAATPAVAGALGMPDWEGSARERLVLTLPEERRTGMVARMSGWLEGMGLAAGLRAVVADIELGCQDLLDTAPRSAPAPAVVRGFVEKCIRRRMAESSAVAADGAHASGNGSGAGSGFAAAAQVLWDRVTATMRAMPWRMIPRDRFTESEWRVIGAVGGLAALAEMDFGDLPHVQRRFIGAYCASQTASALALSDSRSGSRSDSPTQSPEVLRA